MYKGQSKLNATVLMSIWLCDCIRLFAGLLSCVHACIHGPRIHPHSYIHAYRRAGHANNTPSFLCVNVGTTTTLHTATD